MKDQSGRLVEGTSYDTVALKNAVKLYETESNILRQSSTQEACWHGPRTLRDRFGWIENVRMTEAGPYGDYRFYNPQSDLAISLMNAAEMRDGKGFALSHNADGEGEVVGKRYRVRKILEVHSVDVVSDGGTNISLFESLESRPMKIKLAEAGKKYPGLKGLVKLLEAGGNVGQRLLEAEGEDTGDYRDHLHMAKKMCEDAGDSEMAGKIHGLMKPAKDEETPTEGEDKDKGLEEDAMEDEAKDRPAGEKGGTEGKKNTDTVESRRRKPRSKDPHVIELQERLDAADLKEWIRGECDKKAIPLDGKLLTTLTRLREHNAISEHLDYLKGVGVKAKQSPRAVSPFSTSQLRESRHDKPASTVDEFVTALRG